jgi:hypothetical protein
MDFGESVAEAALGASIPLAIRCVLKNWAESHCKRSTPKGRGYARMEELVKQVLRQVPTVATDEHAPPELDQPNRRGSRA